VTLRDSWELRNAAANTLIKVEYQLRDEFHSASLDDLIALLECFSSARSPGPEWTRSFDALTEHLWTWCDPALLAQLESTFRERGREWVSVANAFQPENGHRLRARLEHPPVPSRIPPFTLG
jgi:hypothetical protein